MRPPRAPWALFVLCLALTMTGQALLLQVPAEAMERKGGSLLLSSSFAVVLLVFGAVGAVVASRARRNPIGWLFLALSLLNATYELANGWTMQSLETSARPGAAWTAWWANWSTTVSPALLAAALLLFPDGRLLSRWWRPVLWACIVAMVPVWAHYALVPGPLVEYPQVANPAGVPALAFLGGGEPNVLVGGCLLVSCVSLVLRLRRASGLERQQVKWFAWSAGMLASFLPLAAALTAVVGTETWLADYVAGLLFAVLLAGLPVSAGLAMLRYRLYDIDVVINRTLVYGALTASLVAAYLGSVLVFRVVLSPVTGESQLAVAGSTLAVAALFRPLRARIQSLVDRRFYRSRYDAARTLESFSGRLRDELDLEALGVDLRRVVHDTMQPAHVSLWLREGPS